MILAFISLKIPLKTDLNVDIYNINDFGNVKHTTISISESIYLVKTFINLKRPLKTELKVGISIIKDMCLAKQTNISIFESQFEIFVLIGLKKRVKAWYISTLIEHRPY